jgi:hypothetical protein
VLPLVALLPLLLRQEVLPRLPQRLLVALQVLLAPLPPVALQVLQSPLLRLLPRLPLPVAVPPLPLPRLPLLDVCK